MNLGYVWLGGLVIGVPLIVGGHLLYHWWWCRQWDKAHRNCCRKA